MTSCQCDRIETKFDDEYAAEKLELYRTSGPDPSTRALLDAIKSDGIDITGMTLLDIGGGVGAVQHDLLESGVASVVEVEASDAYVAAAREESARRGHDDRIHHVFGDFGSVADDIEPADIVTLDRSLCCWHDMPQLIDAAAPKARRLFGLVYPRDTWWVRYGWRLLGNARQRLRRNPMRVFIHRSDEVEARLASQGLVQRSHRTMSVWQIAVYERSAS